MTLDVMYFWNPDGPVFCSITDDYLPSSLFGFLFLLKNNEL